MTSATPKPRAGEHTKGPWKAVTDTVHTLAGAQIADCSFAVKAEANARRIVACVNACEGFTDEQLIREPGMVRNNFALREREKALVEALEKLLKEATHSFNETGSTFDRPVLLANVRTLLAKHGR